MQFGKLLAGGMLPAISLFVAALVGTPDFGSAQATGEPIVQPGRSAGDDAVVETPKAPPEPVEVVILGASVSRGFQCPWSDETGRSNRTVPLERALGAVWDDSRIRFRDRSDELTFLDPVGRQTSHVERGLRSDPELVLAIDFMFWFGYGYVRGGMEGRLALQTKAFALLDRFGEVPIVVGDYPDMTGADPRMLRAGQIPSKDGIRQLNEVLRTWAAKRKHVVIFPLAEWVTSMKAEGREVPIDGEPIRLQTVDLMQTDLLHASKLGMAVLAQGLSEIVEKIDPDRFAVADDVTFESIVDGIRATSELEDALAARVEKAGRK